MGSKSKLRALKGLAVGIEGSRVTCRGPEAFECYPMSAIATKRRTNVRYKKQPSEVPDDPYSLVQVETAELHAIVEAYPNLDYKWIAEYAEKALAATIKDSEYVDGKAEKLITFSSALAGILVTAVGRSDFSGTGAWLVPVCASLPVMLLIGAALLAVQAMRVTGQPDLPTIKTPICLMTKIAQDQGGPGSIKSPEDKQMVTEQAFAALSVEIHKARERLTLVISKKSDSMHRAQSCLCWALGSLVVPLMALAFAGSR